jgi:hypothetical protein
MKLHFTRADVRKCTIAELLRWFDEVVSIADEEHKAINARR